MLLVMVQLEVVDVMESVRERSCACAGWPFAFRL